MAALRSLGKKGSWQYCFERPFIILMPAEIASLINEHVPMNKYRSTFYMYCISAVTEERFVQACAFNMHGEHKAAGTGNHRLLHICFNDKWRISDSHLDKTFPLHPFLAACGRHPLHTLPGLGSVWMQQEFSLNTNLQAQLSCPVF